MFAIAVFPLADLRPLIKGERGRLPAPDWRSDDLDGSFLRGFGKVSARNSDSYGLVGERAFADANHAIRFKEPAAFRQNGWSRSLPVVPWFRRLYFDGYSSGRFEIGLLIGHADEDAAVINSGVPYDAGEVAQFIRSIPVTIRSQDKSVHTGPLAQCGPHLGCAYVTASTSNRGLFEFPVTETYGKSVSVGTPFLHLRMPHELAGEAGRNSRSISARDVQALYLTSSKGGTKRNDVVVQTSRESSLAEPPSERAVRVLFTHLNSLIYSQSHLIKNTGLVLSEGDRDFVGASVRRTIAYFDNYAPSSGSALDTEFADAIHAFAKAHAGRLDKLSSDLTEMAAIAAKPSSPKKVLGYMKTLLELVITTSAKAAVETTLRGR